MWLVGPLPRGTILNRLYWIALGAFLGVFGTTAAHAKPSAPNVFCNTYPTAPVCRGAVQCTMCHVSPPVRNVFGQYIESALLPETPRPLSDGEFRDALPDALGAIEGIDSDGDGATNFDEIMAGSLPGKAGSVPPADFSTCPVDEAFGVCGYNPRYVYKKINLDFCGGSPTFDDYEAFDAMPDEGRLEELHTRLDACLDSEYWLGKNGALWRIAHSKIRPIGSLKLGEDQGQIPLADYYDDYNLFVYAQTDNHDARDVLLADYFVARETNPTRYTRLVDTPPTQGMQLDRRSGMMTTRWFGTYFIMFTGMPRTAAAQAYRAYLGTDIAKLEGLYPIEGEPVDYDAKGVTEPVCAGCHSTLDPLTYPFRNYTGIGSGGVGVYVPNRLETYFAFEAPNIGDTPEAGAILGEPVRNLTEWARVAADSDVFAQSTVRDYWDLLVGTDPNEEPDEFNDLWQALMDQHDYSVERMLHDLIETEAYGVR